jgi:NAD(P)-dependent dehydrogenase (short-subunit alcohol dehydrogenase family)
MPLLENKVCIITGGCGSVGLASARRFLAEGARVMLVDLDGPRLASARTSLDTDRVEIFAGDISDPGVVRGYIDTTAAKWGPIDVLFSNAGNHGHIAKLEDYDEDAFDRTYRIHVKGAFLACKYGAPRMHEGGSILVTSSLAGLRGGEGAGENISYTMAKHAQIGVVRAAARALAPRRIRVNALNPGPIDNTFQYDIEERMSAIRGFNITQELNETIPLKRHASPDEVANVALYLASSMSSFITGQVHVVDGGLGS